MTFTPETARIAGAKAAPRGPSKVNAELKAMILGALSDAGGKDYLLARAQDPNTMGSFLSLVGRILPREVTGADGEPIEYLVFTGVTTSAPAE